MKLHVNLSYAVCPLLQHAHGFSKDTADSYERSQASKRDADAIVTCSKRVRETSYLLEMVYPKEKAHLTTPEELHEWRVQRMAKMLEANDVLYFKVIPKDEPERVVAYAG